MNDVKITKLSGGLGRRNPTGDMVTGLIISAVASASFVLDKVYRLKSIKDLIALGIDADYDTVNKLLVFEHVNEFFRVNPDGDLYLLGVARTVSPSDMVDHTKVYSPKILKFANGTIKQLGISYDPTAKVTSFNLVQRIGGHPSHFWETNLTKQTSH